MAKKRTVMIGLAGKKPAKPARKRPSEEKPRKRRIPVLPPKEYPAFEPPEPWPEPKPSKSIESSRRIQPFSGSKTP
jgi:hypothetical protein